jgi:putative transcriptional regulator
MLPSAPVTLKGQFLMAMPGMLDPNFSQTVTCICEHNDSGAMGIVVNRVFDDLTAKAVFDELKIPCVPRAEAIPIHSGGPVSMGELFVLHGPPFQWEACLMVTPSVGLSNTRDIVEAIARDSGPDSFIISLGCAGWGPGQLEDEIMQNAWLTYPVFDENIFKMPIEIRWEEAIKKLGISPTRLSETSGHA